ncbi:MAG TPA: hypothetical protein VI260_23770, partial [Blastocatellia bacterium]
NFLGAPPILACLVSGNDRLTGATRQGWAALQESSPYPRAAIFILSNGALRHGQAIAGRVMRRSLTRVVQMVV